MTDERLNDRVRDAIRARHAGAKVKRDRESLALEIEIEGVWYRARADGGGADREARVTAPLPSTDGFVLAVRWADRWAGGAAHEGTGLFPAPSFDESVIIDTNDLELASSWVDHAVRDALLAARFATGPGFGGDISRTWRDSGWAFEINGDEVSAWRLPGESTPERIVGILEAVLAIAARPTRWIRAFAPAARLLGAELASRIEIGGKPALRTRRGSTDVKISLVRRLGPADAGQLRTVVHARRQPDVKGELSADPRSTQLLELCQPTSSSLRADDIERLFDGALVDPARLDAATELAAHWSTEAPAGPFGPYR